MTLNKIISSFFYFSLITIAPAQNIVSTYAGTGLAGLSNGWIDTCSFNHPFGICFDKDYNIYMADAGNNCIRKINTSTGIVTTLAGTGVAGWRDGASDSAMFQSPIDVCADDSGNIYVSDFANQCIREISYTGMVSTIAGSHTATAGYLDGSADTALFQYPRGICRDFTGNLYIGDSWNHRIRKISTNGAVSTYAGGGIIGVGTVGTLIDASDTSARFYVPCGLSIDTFGNIYVADAYNHRIRKIDVNRMVTTVAGSGPIGMNNGGFADGDSSVARFNTPTELCVDPASVEIFVSDLENNRVRLVNLTSYSVSTFAGNGQPGYNDNVDSLAEFNEPRGISAGKSLNDIYVADYNNNVIRLIEPFAAAGIAPVNAANLAKVFPNPFTDGLNIVNMPAGLKQLKLYDITGRQLMEWQTGNAATTLNISALATGNYILKFSTGDNYYQSVNITKINR